MDSPFSRDYAEAREKFRAGAAAAGAEIDKFRLDHPGPNDLELTTDTAWSARAAHARYSSPFRAHTASRDFSARQFRPSGCNGARRGLADHSLPCTSMPSTVTASRG